MNQRSRAGFWGDSEQARSSQTVSVCISVLGASWSPETEEAGLHRPRSFDSGDCGSLSKEGH